MLLCSKQTATSGAWVLLAAWIFCFVSLVSPQSENCDKMFLGWMGRWWNKVTAEDFANFVSHLEHFFLSQWDFWGRCALIFQETGAPKSFPGEWPKIWLLVWEPAAAQRKHNCTTHPPNVAQLHKILLTCPTQPCTTLLCNATHKACAIANRQALTKIREYSLLDF